MSLEDTLSSLGTSLSSAVSSITSAAPSALGSTITSSQFGQGQFTNTTKLKPEYTLYIDCNELGIHFTAALPPDFSWSMEAVYDTPIKDMLNGLVGGAGTLGRLGQTAARANGLSLVTQALTAKFWTGSSTGNITLPVVLQAINDEVVDVYQPMLSLMSLTMPRTVGNQSGMIFQAPGPHFDIAKAANALVSAGGNAVNNAISNTAAGNSSSNSITSIAGQVVSNIQSAASSIGQGGLSSAIQKTSSAVTTAVTAADSLLKSSIRNNITLRIGNYIQIPSVVILAVNQRHILQPVGGTYGQSTGNMQRIELDISFEPFFDLTQNDLSEIFLDSRIKDYANQLLATAAGTASTSTNTTTTTYPVSIAHGGL